MTIASPLAASSLFRAPAPVRGPLGGGSGAGGDPAPALALDPVPAADDGRPLAIVDIGSNSVRLVIYRGLTRTPVPMLNEKATCALGKGLQDSGVLHPQGVVQALQAVSRFVQVARGIGVARLDLVATAAVRDAWDGPEFVRRLQEATGQPVTVLSGEQEAKTAALGVLCSLPEADGMVADLGGGSLELVMVKRGDFGAWTTLPLGVLRLSEASGGARARALEIIDDHLMGLPWVEGCRGRTLYAVGGAWRTLARVCIAEQAYPLHVLDNFALPGRTALDLFAALRDAPAKSLETIPGISRKRLAQLPTALVLLDRLVEAAEPETVMFSVYGMREGRFFQSLPAEIQAQDPLISSCRDLARSAGRFPTLAEELLAWMAPLFADETHTQARLRLAACLLGDVFWSEHPDYRGEQAFHRVLKLPVMGLSHTDRAGLALAVRARYDSDEGDDWVTRAQSLLDPERVQRVRTIGLAMRLGFAVSGGAPGVIARTALTAQDGVLTLHVPAEDPIYLPEAFSKRLDKLARHLGLEPRLAVLPTASSSGAAADP